MEPPHIDQDSPPASEESSILLLINDASPTSLHEQAVLWQTLSDQARAQAATASQNQHSNNEEPQGNRPRNDSAVCMDDAPTSTPHPTAATRDTAASGTIDPKLAAEEAAGLQQVLEYEAAMRRRVRSDQTLGLESDLSSLEDMSEMSGE